MELFIIFGLVLIIIFLSKSLYILSLEKEYSNNETGEILAEYELIKKRISNGNLITKEDHSNIIRNMRAEYTIANDALKRRLDDVIIQADDIAGKRANELLELWKSREKKEIRKDAIKRSTNVIKGKVLEHVFPHMEDFDYDPRDMRFLGSPIDYLIFDGLSEGEVKNVIFVEVKTGKHAKLSSRERQVRNAIQEGKVIYKKVQLDK